jgi:hypothetical protein
VLSLTGGNRHDVTRLLPLLDAVPPVRGRVAGPAGGPIPLFDHGAPAATARRAIRNVKETWKTDHLVDDALVVVTETRGERHSAHHQRRENWFSPCTRTSS